MDVLLSVGDEIRIYRKAAFKIPDLLYFLSRIASGGFFMTSFILSCKSSIPRRGLNLINFTRLLAAPLHSCSQVLLVTALFSGFTTPLNSSLFLLRIWGVFYGCKRIIAFFSILWLSTFTSFPSAFAVKSHPIGPTNHCIVNAAPHLVSLSFIVATVFDTLVFLAITLTIVFDSPVEGWKARTHLFFKGKNIGHISRALLQTGQLYYLWVLSSLLFITQFTFRSCYSGVLLRWTSLLWSWLSCPQHPRSSRLGLLFQLLRYRISWPAEYFDCWSSVSFKQAQIHFKHSQQSYQLAGSARPCDFISLQCKPALTRIQYLGRILAGRTRREISSQSHRERYDGGPSMTCTTS